MLSSRIQFQAPVENTWPYTQCITFVRPVIKCIYELKDERSARLYFLNACIRWMSKVTRQVAELRALRRTFFLAWVKFHWLTDSYNAHCVWCWTSAWSCFKRVIPHLSTHGWSSRACELRQQLQFQLCNHGTRCWDAYLDFWDRPSPSLITPFSSYILHSCRMLRVSNWCYSVCDCLRSSQLIHHNDAARACWRTH
jgi:hypothetical protein